MFNIAQWTMGGSKQSTKGAKCCPFIFSSSPRQVIQYKQSTYLNKNVYSGKKEKGSVFIEHILCM